MYERSQCSHLAMFSMERRVCCVRSVFVSCSGCRSVHCNFKTWARWRVWCSRCVLKPFTLIFCLLASGALTTSVALLLSLCVIQLRLVVLAAWIYPSLMSWVSSGVGWIGNVRLVVVEVAVRPNRCLRPPAFLASINRDVLHRLTEFPDDQDRDGSRYVDLLSVKPSHAASGRSVFYWASPKCVHSRPSNADVNKPCKIYV